MKKMFKGMLVLFAGTILLAGCGGSSSTSDESRLRGRYRELERYVERRDLAVMELYDTDYLDSGWTYVDIRNSFAGFYDRYRNIDEHFTITDIRVNGNFADVYFTEWFEADDTFDGGRRVQSYEEEFVAVWKYEYGDWYQYGNQRAEERSAVKPRLFNRERPIKPLPKDG